MNIPREITDEIARQLFEDLRLHVIEEKNEEIEKLKKKNEAIGPWLSAALEDPNICKEMKQDIEYWFEEEE